MGYHIEFFVISRKKPIDVWEVISHGMDALDPKKCSASSKLKRFCDFMEKNLHEGNLNVLNENGKPDDSVCIIKLEIWLSILHRYSAFLYPDSEEVPEFVWHVKEIKDEMERLIFDGKRIACYGSDCWPVDALSKYGNPASMRDLAPEEVEQVLKNHLPEDFLEDQEVCHWWTYRGIFVENEKDMLPLDIFYWELRKEMEKSGSFKYVAKDAYLKFYESSDLEVNHEFFDTAIQDENFIREVKDFLKNGKVISWNFV